ncbi:hypothetical protein C8Q80DRAFT_147997 [Daedaleopsis nitida]|nr:hypothetical protein C8Q80DRAFT_147997 [Daedaleopsis nitida]
MHPYDYGNPHKIGLLDVPDEILLQVLQYLDLQDIVALRKTCAPLYTLTQDRYVWLYILREQSRSVPLPPHLEHPSSWAHLPIDELEVLVRRIQMVDRNWLRPRSHYFLPGHCTSCSLDPVFNNDDGARTIYSIEVFLDRWLLCIYHEKLVEVWDLDSVIYDPLQPILCTSTQIKAAGSFSAAMTFLGRLDNILTIAVSCHELCHIIQVRLYNSRAIHAPKGASYDRDVEFRTIAVVPFASPIFSLRALDPERSLLLLGLPSSFHLLNWDTQQRTVVNMLSEEEEDLWNGVVAATFLTHYHILVLKAHSLEICTLLDSPQLRMHTQGTSTGGDADSRYIKGPALQMSAAVHSHFFPNLTFRSVSFSRPITHTPTPSNPHEDTDPTTVSLTFLAFDVLRGLFHCYVSIIIPPSESLNTSAPHTMAPPIDVRVRLLSAHNMAVPVPPGIGHSQRSGMSNGTRGFVSACALGPAGRRGAWVERRRGAVRRVVYGFSTHAEEYDDDDDDDVADGIEFAGRPPPYPCVKKQPKVKSGKGKHGRSRQTTNSHSEPIATAEADAESANPGWNAQEYCEIEGKEVYEVNSYDLRDDITHIAFSETTGLIALGTRKGDVRVLGRSDSGSEVEGR